MTQSFQYRLRRAALWGDAREVSRLWSGLEGTANFIDLDPTLNAILRCHPRAAGAMMEGLRAFASTTEARFFRSRLYVACRTTREKVKLLSVLHAAGFDLGRSSTYSLSGKILYQHAQKLESFRGSNHARMTEQALEPDPVALLARPMGQTFHGTVPGSSNRNITYVQPFLGRWRRVPEELRSLAVGFPLASAVLAAILMMAAN